MKEILFIKSPDTGRKIPGARTADSDSIPGRFLRIIKRKGRDIMKRIGVLVLGFLLVLILAVPSGAGLCSKCKDGMYTMDIGKCVICGGATSSGAFKLCKVCSAKLGQCEHCRGPLVSGQKKGTPLPSPGATREKMLILREADRGKTVAAKVGQRIAVVLFENRTTGYGWVLGKIEGDVLRQVKKEDIEILRDIISPGKPVVGGGSEAVVAAFDVVKEGRAIVKLEYVRQWEKKNTSGKTFAVTIDVKSAGSESEPAKTSK